MEHLRRRWSLYASGLVLLVGVGSSVLMYRAAESVPQGHTDTDPAYGFDPDYSKQNLRQLELYGGQANVLAYQLRSWWLGLWQGKSAALMVAAISVLVALAILCGAGSCPGPMER